MSMHCNPKGLPYKIHCRARQQKSVVGQGFSLAWNLAKQDEKV
jgi:hypothetical protein